MKWWDDLWLNESFATYIPTKFLSLYGWGYSTDQLVPINLLVQHTGERRLISYSKGNSVLKQLHFIPGRIAIWRNIRQADTYNCEVSHVNKQ